MSPQEKRNFRKLSNVEHVRLRTGMWLGQNSLSTYSQHFFTRTGKNGSYEITHEEIQEIPAKMKCLDEAVMNCVDEYRKNLGDTAIPKPRKMNTIRVDLSPDQKTIQIADNGRGIPAANAEGVYLHLMYGENFDDEVKRDHVAGQNGVGISLVRIVSQHFKVETCNQDTCYAKVFTVTPECMQALKSAGCSKDAVDLFIRHYDEHGNINTFTAITDVQKKKIFPVMKKTGMIENISGNSRGRHGTLVEFTLDPKYFNGADLPFNVRLLGQYLQDIAMTNPGLKVVFTHKKNEVTYIFQKGIEDIFKSSEMPYYRMNYRNKETQLELDSYFVGGQNKCLSWVNSNFASLGGSPVEYLENRVCDEIRKKPGITALEKRLKISSTRNDVRNCFHIYNNFYIVNPRFKSQDKSYLINDLNEDIRQAVDQNLDKIIKKLDLLNEVKQQMEKRCHMKAFDDAARDLRKANRNAIPKLIPATGRGNDDKRTLFVAEGDSAIAGLRPARDPRLHALFPLRGKPLNVLGMNLAKAMQNEEIKNIVAIMNLPITGKVKSINELNYHRISIVTDADYDGYAIRSLMLSFFYEYWPELFELGVIHISAAPLYEVEVENPQKQKKIFYCIDDAEYESLIKKCRIGACEIIRKKRNKGLGETSKEAMRYTVANCMTRIVLKNRKTSRKTQELWFHKSFAEQRRNAISEYSALFFDE